MNKNLSPGKVGNAMTSPKNVYNYLEQAVKVWQKSFTALLQLRVCITIPLFFAGCSAPYKLYQNAAYVCEGAQSGIVSSQIGNILPSEKKQKKYPVKLSQLDFHKTGICRLFGHGNLNNCLLFTDCIVRICLGFWP